MNNVIHLNFEHLNKNNKHNIKIFKDILFTISGFILSNEEKFEEIAFNEDENEHKISFIFKNGSYIGQVELELERYHFISMKMKQAHAHFKSKSEFLKFDLRTIKNLNHQDLLLHLGNSLIGIFCSFYF